MTVYLARLSKNNRTVPDIKLLRENEFLSISPQAPFQPSGLEVAYYSLATISGVSRFDCQTAQIRAITEMVTVTQKKVSADFCVTVTP